MSGVICLGVKPQPGARDQRQQHPLLQARSTPWWQEDASTQYATDLLKDLGTTYNLDMSQVYWTGYSGGADTIAEHMTAKYSTGGTAVLVAGRAVYGQSKLARPISTALKNDFPMHRVIGAKDIPAAGGRGLCPVPTRYLGSWPSARTPSRVAVGRAWPEQIRPVQRCRPSMH